ncbi:phage portal protein [Weissella paramesenteroides]|uniref:phage portal protein n=2 Tax=Weissella paramesenteroides TaxID=1249 RepID=UPI002073138C|nr:phage portal protein [Weissella paramesenteroides]MCM6765888.1 phage portal protein [Weissella paramesenteroides]MCM6767257.1 phage portal protein [Weissella paramesenteroides]MCM6770003.1 phage portal protein [Weissella paramesenteroides]MCM6779925.1 phage portal protein [Weissella paramesenteroides]MCM6781527.1 phage portal protein [Weissella paramesenteroides]
MGVTNTLTNITDHPRIGVPEAEYDRIRENLMYFEGKFKDVAYRNTYGEIRHRPYTSLNMAQVLVRRMASLLVNEQMTFTIADNKSADEYVHDVFSKNDFVKNFERYLESGLALGGLAMRPYIDGNEIKIAYVQAPVFFPLQSNANDISEAAIATKTTTVEGNNTVYWTLLEFHSWNGNKYVIDNELYRSMDANAVGVRQTLSANEIYANLADHSELDNFTRPLFVYLKPFGFNNRDITSPLGLSIFDNARSTLRQINDAYDQFHWEVKMGQRRVMVPENLTQMTNERGEFVQLFDTDQNVYVGLNSDMDDIKITDLSTDIRADQFIQSINQFIKTLEMQTGLSAGTFSFDAANGLKTATEVVSENSMTYQTRNSHLNNVERALQELVVTVLELATAEGFYHGDIPRIGDIQFNFDDGVFTDKSVQLAYYMQASTAGLISKKRAIMKVFDVPEEEAMEILQEIADESEPVPSALDQSIYDNAAGDE